MKRTLFITGLTLSLACFGSLAVLAVWAGITRGHLNFTGWLFLVGGLIICLIALRELRRQLRSDGSVLEDFGRLWRLYRIAMFTVLIPILIYCAITRRISIPELCILLPLSLILAWGNYSLFKNRSRLR
jgi:hypothetical protein